MEISAYQPIVGGTRWHIRNESTLWSYCGQHSISAGDLKYYKHNTINIDHPNICKTCAKLWRKENPEVKQGPDRSLFHSNNSNIVTEEMVQTPKTPADYPIGAKFEWEGVMLEVAKDMTSGGCTLCFFKRNGCRTIQCGANGRVDNEDAIYCLIPSGEESTHTLPTPTVKESLTLDISKGEWFVVLRNGEVVSAYREDI